MNDLWVFGYGSLIWRPGFAFEERHRARLAGYRRSLCVYSYRHRGTPQEPGLVFGLDQGGSCIGMAYRVAPAASEAVIAYLRERELQGAVYREAQLPVRLLDGRRVRALCYVVRRDHVQYAGRLDPGDAARLVGRSHGQSGPNDQYVLDTLREIESLGIRDRWLEAVAACLHGSTRVS